MTVACLGGVVDQMLRVPRACQSRFLAPRDGGPASRPNYSRDYLLPFMHPLGASYRRLDSNMHSLGATCDPLYAVKVSQVDRYRLCA